ncbi:histone [Halomarina oriensis]|uniref:Aldolase n=1 Tax=Halomarina oriensis TaxID=671145 RepID=A0A6B0GLI7_9EURY|nr:histone [Halomarina oriensis]MWG32985.1 aldolase [Halomarina oriensis]
MSVELPFAPVDAIIRRNAGELRVSADAAETLARRIQERGAALATEAAQRATADGRKTLMAEDFAGPSADGGSVDDDGDATVDPAADGPDLPIAPIDRIARLDIDDRYRVSMDARIALAGVLETYAEDVAAAAAVLARHADRRTVIAEDIEAYFELDAYFPPG